VEGASSHAAAIATADGHSRDGTLETLRRFKAEEDPENKVQIVLRDGFWSEKDEQSQAYAERASGDYLWQVDIDEFYQPGDIEQVLRMLRDDPGISAISLRQIAFWGGFDYLVDGWYLRRGADVYHRLFKWGPGYRYVSHRPPTVHDEQGRDLRTLRWVRADELEKHGIVMYHYSLLLPKQVQEKCDYYSRVPWTERSQAQQWAEEVFLQLRRPFQVHNVYEYPSWLSHFGGTHPPQAAAMRADLETGQLPARLRPTADIERLLRAPWYGPARALVQRLEPLDRRSNGGLLRWRYRLKRLWRDPRGLGAALWQRLARRATPR
nr:glycosyltransferase family 2 protein [Chloroflexaceae bacterium]